MSTGFFLAGLITLIFCSAFFSGSETALFSLSSIQVRKFLAGQNKNARIAARLISKPRNLLISILIGNQIVNIFSSSLSASFFRNLFIGTNYEKYSESISAIMMIILIIIFGEIAPKTYAIQNSEKLAVKVAPILGIHYLIVTPLRYLLFNLTNGIVLMASKILRGQEPHVSASELKTAATLGHTAGIIRPHEKELIHGVLRLEGRQVREIMTPRMEFIAFEENTSIDEIRTIIQEKNYMRIPIYRCDMDNIRGILYAKDLFMARRTGGNDIRIVDILRPAFFVPETLHIDVMLEEFRKGKTHIAIAVDEYGSVTGLITLEDVLEVIVGNLYDKADEQRLFRKVDEDSIIVSSLLPIEEFNDMFNTDIEDEYVVTIGGFVTHLLGHIPKEDDTLFYEGLEFKVMKASKNRIEEMLVKRILNQEGKD